MFDFPNMPQRPRSADYPGYSGNDQPGQRLYRTIDGNPIQPDSRIVGRGTAGGRDLALDPAGYDAIAQASTGRPIETVSSLQWPNGQFAVTYRNADGTPRLIEIADDVAAASIDYLRAHENGHALDFFTAPSGREIPSLDVEKQLRRIYNDGNNTDRSMVGREAFIGYSKPPPVGIVSPETRGYLPGHVEAELWAEAARAYLSNPNYIKSVAPEVAAILREAVNNHPVLSRALTLNVGGIPIPLAPLPDTLQQVRLPGGASVAPLSDLMIQAMRTNAPPPAVRPPLGPEWAGEYHATYQDASTPEFAARVAREAQQHAERIEAKRIETERRWWEQAYAEGRAV